MQVPASKLTIYPYQERKRLTPSIPQVNVDHAPQLPTLRTESGVVPATCRTVVRSSVAAEVVAGHDFLSFALPIRVQRHATTTKSSVVFPNSVSSEKSWLRPSIKLHAYKYNDVSRYHFGIRIQQIYLDSFWR